MRPISCEVPRWLGDLLLVIIEERFLEKNLSVRWMELLFSAAVTRHIGSFNNAVNCV